MTTAPVDTRSEDSPSDNGEAPALRLDSVSVRFGGVRALSDVTLDIPAGIVCGLIGPNGAGKSTLFDVTSGVVRASSGRVHVHGADVTKQPAQKVAEQRLRRTFQRVQLFGRLTVEENLVTSFERSHRRRTGSGTEAVSDVLDRCGLDDVRHTPAGSLPIGRARALELARALVAEPRILLLDEPTSGLGYAETERLRQVILDYRNRGGTAVVVEHDMPFVTGVSDRLVVLHLGSVIAEGDPETVRADPQVQEAYLG